MLYLILHCVRGEPAFDIAERCDEMGIDSDPGPWWIIPTSGHRAYPYRNWNLADLVDASDINAAGNHDHPYYRDEIPVGWPDHYATRATPTEPGLLRGALEKLMPKREPIVRRV